MNFNGTPQQLFWQGSPRDIVFGIDEIRTDIKIPMDLRHHSKIDYENLRSLI